VSAEVRAWVGLGANLGDARATIEAAFDALAGLPGTRLAARSALYRSAPVEAGGPDFVNAVAALDTPLPPLALLQALHAIEAGQGRERPYHHAPRTLDLDLLLHGKQVISTPVLTLPHPRLHLRAFVLLPLLELAPDLRHPTLGLLQPWLSRVAEQRVVRLR
jgi:2-amino-4-hydroxy-6-hydroxymethyldihydropteridine diphosphokinase